LRLLRLKEMKLSTTRYDTTTLDPTPGDEAERGFFDRIGELQGNQR